MMLYTHKQMMREVERRVHEENLRRATEQEFERLYKRVSVLEERVRTLEYKIAPETVLTNTECRT